MRVYLHVLEVNIIDSYPTNNIIKHKMVFYCFDSSTVIFKPHYEDSVGGLEGSSRMCGDCRYCFIIMEIAEVEVPPEMYLCPSVTYHQFPCKMTVLRAVLELYVIRRSRLLL